MCNWINFFSTVKRLFRYGKPYRNLLLIAVLMLWGATTLEIIGPILISYFINHILSYKYFSYQGIFFFILVFILLQTLSATLRYYQSLLFNKTALSIVETLRKEVMNSMLNQPLKIFNNQTIGQLISKVTNDTEVIKDLYITVVSTVLCNLALISTMLIAMFLLEWRLACILLILFPIIILIMWLYQHYSVPIIRKIRFYIAEISNNFNEVINGMEIIQQFRQQRRFGIKLHKTSYDHLKAKMKTLKLEGYLLRPLLSLLFTLILCGMLLVFSATSKEIISVSILYIFINYLGRLNEPLIELTSQQSILQQATVAGERIFEIIDSPTQKYGSDDLPISKGQIELHNVEFSYCCKSKPVLRNISLKIPANSFTALIGRTGSGKSTLASLIMGHYPIQKGLILIDGRPIETLSHKVLRQGIAMVHQDPVIMAETVYNNIALGRKISQSKIWNILEQLQLASVIESLPKGLFSKLSEQGNTLSAGQKQLLSLARVLVFNPVILILDEATAKIDSITEQIINNVLNILKDHTTLIVIAHRLSTITSADQIIVISDGKIKESFNYLN